MKKIITAQELAMIFYDNMVENGDDTYDPDSKFTRLLNEIEAILERELDFELVSKLESLILDLCSEDLQQHYVWGFCTALAVARVVFDNDAEIL